jgi:hypothetical protein
MVISGNLAILFRNYLNIDKFHLIILARLQFRTNCPPETRINSFYLPLVHNNIYFGGINSPGVIFREREHAPLNFPTLHVSIPNTPLPAPNQAVFITVASCSQMCPN